MDIALLNPAEESATSQAASMRPAVFHDARLQGVEWRDLVAVRRMEVLKELLLPSVWLVASLLLAWRGRYGFALGCSFFFFLTGLRLVHNAFHGAIGLSRRGTEIVLWVMSAVMLGSMHAVQFNHLRHHKLNLGEGDVEGRSAEMPAWQAILFGPFFPVLLHATALRQGHRRLRRTVLAELVMTALWIGVVFGVLHNRVLHYHVAAMLVGQCMTAFFAVWTVHHHCDRSHALARTMHSRIKNLLSFNMFLHIEHHLFPRVPTCHLPELSRRIDRVAPDLRSKIVF